MLWQIFDSHDGKFIQKWDHYFPIYEAHLSHLVGKEFFFLEIGVGQGGSLQMWRKYFGPLATIVGIDHMPRCKKLESEGTFCG